MSAIILDTECTGLIEPDVIELAYVQVKNLEPNQDISTPMRQRFCPRKPITPAAMAVHNIILTDLENEPTWPGVWQPMSKFIIGHGIDFDWEAIGKPDVRRICTLALSRFLYPDLDSHKLGALLYHLLEPSSAREYVSGAHGAVADVGMCWILLGFLLDVAETRRLLLPSPSFESLWDLSEMARIPLRIHFGKYGPFMEYGKANGGKGMLISEMCSTDPRYARWILNETDQARDDEYLQKALRMWGI